MTRIIGIALKPKKELEQKIKRLKEYMRDRDMWEKDEHVIETIENFNEVYVNNYSEGDTVVFVGLKDLYHIGMPGVLRHLIEMVITIHIIPY